MPIFHHTKTHGRFFFIHVPRTAGRFLRENFKRNGYKIEHHLTKKILKEKKEMDEYTWTSLEGVEIPHLHYSLYSKWKNIKGIPFIAIIRNPIDRFFSGSFYFSPRFNFIQSSFEDWTSFQNILSEYMCINANNWWRPQHEFVSPHTKIWKYEKGFGKNFCAWINKILPIDISIKTQDYLKDVYDYPGLRKTEALINNIKKFYRKDFEDFDY